MTFSEPAGTVRRRRTLAGSRAPRLGITVYGCGPDEAELFRDLAPRFGITPKITDAAVTEATVELAFGNRSISVDHRTPITNATLDALSRIGVRYLSTRSIGCNHLDVRHAASVGITVETTSYSPDSVADYTLMLILMALRQAKSMIRRTDDHDYRLPAVRGRELRDLTVGVIGTGRIGAAVIERLRGFGCRVLAFDLRPTAAADHLALDDLLPASDVITLHLPLTAATHRLLDRRRIGLLKPGGFVVNTGRGALLDTEALLDALADGRVAGAALDVLEGEEGIFYTDCRDRRLAGTLVARLQALPNVVISPHTAYYTDHALQDTVEHSLINCRTFESGHQHG